MQAHAPRARVNFRRGFWKTEPIPQEEQPISNPPTGSTSMTGTTQQRRAVSLPNLIVASALLVAASVSQAQTCAGALPTPTDKSVTGGDKFRLITSQCPGVAEPLTVHRAGQLDLYERGSITIKMS